MTYSIRLFGELEIAHDDIPVQGLQARRVQELLAYLFLHHDRALARANIAGLLWENGSEAESLKCLRQTLWRVKKALNGSDPTRPPLIYIDSESITIHADADYWLDTAMFESAFLSLYFAP